VTIAHPPADNLAARYHNYLRRNVPRRYCGAREWRPFSALPNLPGTCGDLHASLRVWVNRVHDGDRATFLAVTASPGPCRVFQALNRIGPASGRARCGPGSGPDVHRGDRGMITAWLVGIESKETMKTQAAPEAVHARA
jgi:hypothetical protein